MGVEHSLGSARGARGVAEPHRLALVDLRPRVLGGLAGQEVLVGDDAGERGLGHLGIEDDDVGRRRGDLCHGLLEERKQIGVDEHGAVVGVPHDERELLGRHPYVECVEHASGTRARRSTPRGAGSCSRRAWPPSAPRARDQDARGHASAAGSGGRTPRRSRRSIVPGGGATDDLRLGCVVRRMLEQEPRVQRGLHHRTAPTPVPVRRLVKMPARSFPGQARRAGAPHSRGRWARRRLSPERVAAHSDQGSHHDPELPTALVSHASGSSRGLGRGDRHSRVAGGIDEALDVARDERANWLVPPMSWVVA